MSRDTDLYVYVPVPFLRDGDVYARLKAEAGEHSRRKDNPPIGPYIANLLEARDNHLYGDGTRGSEWLAGMDLTPDGMRALVQQALEEALSGSTLSRTAPVEVPPEMIEADTEDAILDQSMAFAEGYDDDSAWGTLAS
jgi:hypothetical protein